MQAANFGIIRRVVVTLHTIYTSLNESFHTGRLYKCVHIVYCGTTKTAFLSVHIFRFGVLKHREVKDHVGKSGEECVARGPGVSVR